MEFIQFLLISKSCWGKLNQVYKFLFSDEVMTTIFKNLGELDSKTAISALKDSQESENPAREIEEAISHLRAGSTKFLAAAEKRRFFGLRSPTCYARSSGYHGFVELSILMALCYSSLGSKLANNHLDNAKKYFELYANAEIDCAKTDAKIRSGGVGMGMAAGGAHSYSSELDEIGDLVPKTQKRVDNERLHLEQLIDSAKKGQLSIPKMM